MGKRRVSRGLVCLLLVGFMFLSPLAVPSRGVFDVIFDGVMLGISAAQCADAIQRNDPALIAIDCGGAVLDLAALFLPGIPAAGGAVARLGSKSVTKADDVYDIARAAAAQASNVDEYVDILKQYGIVIPRTADEMKAGKMIFDNYDDALAFVTNKKYYANEKIYTLQRHHLNPQMASSAFGLSVGRSMTVVLGQEVHASAFTTQLTKLITTVYGATKSTDSFSLTAANAVKYLQGLDKLYANYPLIKAVAQTEFMMSKGAQQLRTLISFSATGLTSYFNRNLDVQKMVEEYNNSPLTTRASMINLHDWSAVSGIETVTLTADPIATGNSISDVTADFAGQTVRLTSVASGQPVCGENNATVHAGTLCATAAGEYETTLTADGWLGFRLKGGKWLSVQNRDYLRTEGDALSAWECFKVYKKDGYHYLLSQKNNSFVQVSMEEPAKPLAAARPYYDGLEGATWERFTITSMTPPQTGGASGAATGGAASSQVSEVRDRYYYKTPWISGEYSGQWKNGAPNGEGTLKYATASKMYQSGARSHVGGFADGARMGWGTTYYDPALNNGAMYYEGTWYGMYATDKVVFEGKVYFSSGSVYRAVLTARNDVNADWTVWELVEGGGQAGQNGQTDQAGQNDQSAVAVQNLSLAVGPSASHTCPVVTWQAAEGAERYVIYREIVATGAVISYSQGRDLLDFVDSEVMHTDYGYGLLRYRLEAYDGANRLVAQSSWVEYEHIEHQAKLYAQFQGEGIYFTWSVSGYPSYNLMAHEEDAVGVNSHTWAQTPIPLENTGSAFIAYDQLIPGKSYRFYIGSGDTGRVCISNLISYTAASSTDSQSGWQETETTTVGDGADGSGGGRMEQIVLYINYPQMDTPSGRVPIDSSGTEPIIENGRTLVPVRGIIEAMGGMVEWDADQRQITCRWNGSTVHMWIGRADYRVSSFSGGQWIDSYYEFDVAPQIIKGRTMIPVRAVFEALGCQVDWGTDSSGNWDGVRITYQAIEDEPVPL